MSAHTVSDPNCVNVSIGAINGSHICIRSSDDVNRLYVLLVTYAQDPARAALVTEVTIDTAYLSRGYASNCLYNIDEKTLDDETTARLMKAVDWKRSHLDGTWQGSAIEHKEMNEKFAEAATALLMSLCENISNLYLAERLFSGHLGEYMLRNNYGQNKKPCLQHLKQVHLLRGATCDERDYGRIEMLLYIQCIHRLPALESVSMDSVEEYQLNHDFFVPGTGNMTKIVLAGCDISDHVMATIISIPKALREFKVSLGGLWTIDGGRDELRVQYVREALTVHKNCLRVLDLSLGAEVSLYVSDSDPEELESEEEREELEYEEEQVRIQHLDYGLERLPLDKAISVRPDFEWKRPHGATIGSFHDFPHLRRLSVSMAVLPYQSPSRLIDGLPPSLEYLCLCGYTRGENSNVDENVDELMEKKGEKLPRLTVIEGV
ncbi:hypothetical protein FIE12Z_1666 [Fusarium flagelliforme]|uniref:Uncharacterized protein n=1 Tax=Fusarium flagelliforme TaxID=2675880 RepID=A0A395N3B9_9HYPO|nr:hypothetical protein FIE12Z_1666 [Fusarium flagelliforme]